MMAHLSEVRGGQRPAPRHAIVIGASMAGLLATRVLADHFEQVTLVERDAFPPEGEHRRGVPQGRHTHGLLAGGKQVLEQLFPGISQELINGGAVNGDLAHDSRWFLQGACLCKFTSGLGGLLLSRPFLEGKVRNHLLRLPNVRARESCEVEGLATSEDRQRVTGIRVAGEILPADLVVDATGRGSHSPQWLEQMGFPKPREERIEIALGYTTRLFRRSLDDLDGDGAAVIPPTPETKRAGVMLAQEGDRWTVTLVSYFGNYAPTDLEGFIEFARNLPAPFIYDVIRRAEPISEPASARFPASVRRRYENLDRFPDGFVVFGDAISSFNPMYGQGMSVAALEAVQLGETLAEGTADLARRFFRKAAKVVDSPWNIVAGGDLRIPETVGPRNAGVNFINWYMSKLHRAAHHDPVVALAFHEVGNLLAPPETVMHPRIVARVLWGNLRPRSKTPAGEQAMRASAGGQ
jgi:2-polyprenyl-6-methoxyphenol hydroxylase-like FAD-dependent oxidoreductase